MGLERVVCLPAVCLRPQAGGFGMGFSLHRYRSILEVHGGLVTVGLGAMPTVEATEEAAPLSLGLNFAEPALVY